MSPSTAPQPGACELCVCDDLDTDACSCCHTAPCQVTDPSAPLLVTRARPPFCRRCHFRHFGLCAQPPAKTGP